MFNYISGQDFFLRQELNLCPNLSPFTFHSLFYQKNKLKATFKDMLLF